MRFIRVSKSGTRQTFLLSHHHSLLAFISWFLFAHSLAIVILVYIITTSKGSSVDDERLSTASLVCWRQKLCNQPNIKKITNNNKERMGKLEGGRRRWKTQHKINKLFYKTTQLNSANLNKPTNENISGGMTKKIFLFFPLRDFTTFVIRVWISHTLYCERAVYMSTEYICNERTWNWFNLSSHFNVVEHSLRHLHPYIRQWNFFRHNSSHFSHFLWYLSFVSNINSFVSLRRFGFDSQL